MDVVIFRVYGKVILYNPSTFESKLNKTSL